MGSERHKNDEAKSRGAGIMVSNFIDEHHELILLTDEEYDKTKQINPSSKKFAHQFLEYGEKREGSWTRDRFLDQMKGAVKNSNTRRRMGGTICGCLTTAPATQ